MSLCKTLTSLLGGLSVAGGLLLMPPLAAAASPSHAASLHPSSLASKGITPLGNVTASPKPSTRPSPAQNSSAAIETMTLPASKLLTSYHYYEADNDGPPYCGLHTNGMGPAQTNPGEILAGYFRYWDPGTQPFPCCTCPPTTSAGFLIAHAAGADSDESATPAVRTNGV